MKAIQKIVSTTLATATIATGLVGFGVVAPAMADECKGETKSEVISVDPMTGGQVEEIKMDSYKTQELIDGYGNVKDATGLIGLLGAGY